jgi:glycerate 2-kinase
VHAAIEAVDAASLVRRALNDHDLGAALTRAAATDVIAVGKAALPMLRGCAGAVGVPVRHELAIGPSGQMGPSETIAGGGEWHGAGHPLPNEDSVAAARRALEVAAGVTADDLLLVLLSGGGSALMALPTEDLTLADKQRAVRMLMEQGADIHELNTVRKHLSAIKGGQLAVAARGSILTLAISDVVGDDLSVIASGPTVADASTFGDAVGVLSRRGGDGLYPAAVVQRLRRGARGEIRETPKPGDPRLTRSNALVIGPQRGAIEGARRAAESLGYRVYVVPDPVTGEARVAGAGHVRHVATAVRSLGRPACVISSGETTVNVVGAGRGGRNQEFACAMAGSIGQLGEAAAASIGTDGIDGPTDAAGAIIDSTTLRRAAAAGAADPELYLRENNTYAFFDRLGDLIRTGPTGTNVGDLQVVLVAQPPTDA